MNMKKTWKRFFSLDRRHAEGFTLVELIVVIAILAILGGVAVPAYSGYVEKANMQADISLISEIEHALTLAYYNQQLDGAGFLMLMPAGSESETVMFDETTGIDEAMVSTFGAGWQDMMVLKHDSWGTKNMLLTSSDAQNVVNSNFTTKYSPDELMSQVQAMTDAVNGLSFDIGSTKVELYNMFNYTEGENTSNVIVDVMKEYGIGESQTDWDKLTAEEKSNILVLATASSVSNGKNTGATSVIPTYALYTAYAAENETFNEAYKTFQNTIQNVDPNTADSQVDQIKAAYKTLEQAAKDNGFEAWETANGPKNEAAFNAIMAGVGNAMADNKDAILGELGNADMFTSGIGNQMYKDYLNSAYAAAGGVGDDGLVVGDVMSWAGNGNVVIGYTVTNGQLYIDNSLPTNG